MLKFSAKDNSFAALGIISHKGNARLLAAGIDLEFHRLSVAAFPILEDDGEGETTKYCRFAFP
jgi:hypothetical protein